MCSDTGDIETSISLDKYFFSKSLLINIHVNMHSTLKTEEKGDMGRDDNTERGTEERERGRE